MRTLSTTWTHIRRSPYQAFAAITTMFLTFLLVGIFSLATVSSALILRYFESKPQITVFFTDAVLENDARELENTLKATGKTASIRYVSKEEALGLYQEQNKDDPLLLEMVTADILPASLEVSAVDPSHLSELEPILTSTQGVDEVVYQRDVVDALLVWTKAIRIVGGSLAALLALNSLLIVMTVISMKIALKREEIDVFKLVGASSWYIRLPFIIEGGLYGAFGSTLAWFIISILLIWFRLPLISFLGGIGPFQMLLSDPLSSSFLLFLAGFWGVLFLSGFILGMVGGLVALARYLKF